MSDEAEWPMVLETINPDDVLSLVLKERDRLHEELQLIVLNGTHANHKYQVCAVCMAKRALGMKVDEAYVRNLPKPAVSKGGKAT